MGSARVSRAGDGVLAIADFFMRSNQSSARYLEVRFGATPLQRMQSNGQAFNQHAGHVRYRIIITA